MSRACSADVVEVHAALEAVRERALAAAAGVDLRLDDELLACPALRRRRRLPPAVLATAPLVVATPNFSKSSRAWYSWMFMKKSGPVL